MSTTKLAAGPVFKRSPWDSSAAGWVGGLAGWGTFMEPSNLGPALLDRGQGEARPHFNLMYQQANTIWQENPTI